MCVVRTWLTEEQKHVSNPSIYRGNSADTFFVVCWCVVTVVDETLMVASFWFLDSNNTHETRADPSTDVLYVACYG